MSIYCNNCGREIGEDNKYCPYCGKPIDNINFGKISETNFEVDEDRTDNINFDFFDEEDSGHDHDKIKKKKKTKSLNKKFSKTHLIVIISVFIFIAGTVLFFIFNDVTFELKDNTPKPATKPQSEAEIVNYYKTCLDNFCNNENGKYTKKKWQNMCDAGFVNIPVVNDIIAYMFEKNFVSEKQAESIAYNISTEEGKNEFIAFDLDDESVITSAYAEVINGNYLLTINFMDVTNPEYQSSFLSNISNDIFYRSDIIKMIEAFPQLKDPGNTDVKYKKFTIICEATPYKELVNIKHNAEMEISIEEAKIYLMPVEQIKIDLNTQTEYSDFIYSR